MTPIKRYLEKLQQRFLSNRSTEYSYRTDLQVLLESLLTTDFLITHESKQIEYNRPDYTVSRNNLDIGWIETKDIGKDLDSKDYKEQFERYKCAFDNLIITDYLRFDFYNEGVKVRSVCLAMIENNKIIALPNNNALFIGYINDFAFYIQKTIVSAEQLAKVMAGKARLLANIIEMALNEDNKTNAESSLKEQLNGFKNVLLHDINNSEFADIYAQTIAYGLFSAYLHDKSPKNFSRQRAASNIPLSNPFLKQLFDHVSSIDFDKRLAWLVDTLAKSFCQGDAEKLMKSFNYYSLQNDPIIHFYETFLAEYDPKLRKSRGVWYTPQPVVNFMVRAVNDILKSEFNLSDGLADNTKIEIETFKNKRKIKQVVHRLQILDPATGTGTFLAEIIKYIFEIKFQSEQENWSDYVEHELIPRLNGFELLMASYSMAHLKLDLLLTSMGYEPVKKPRLNIYLTNSLEKEHPDTKSLHAFEKMLSKEANAANRIKRDIPVMLVIGNPPYSVSSSNKNAWIESLIMDYKKDLNERKINLDDDYIKFIRYGQYLIDKNGSGILAYISNNSFIDGVTHRKMRQSLLQSFDAIYILDLHGNLRKKEVCADGSIDQNVFDIMQGVSINIFIKNNKKTSEFADVYHFDMQGNRQFKYEALNDNNLQSITWQKLNFTAPYFFFVSKNFNYQTDYEEGFKLDELMNGVSGIETKRDNFAIDYELHDLKNRITDFIKNDYIPMERKKKFALKDNEWIVEEAVEKLRKNNDWENSFIRCLTRPFDLRWIIYNKIILSRDRGNIMAGMNNNNFGLILARQTKEDFSVLMTKYVCTHKIVTVYDRSFIFPLYLYTEETNQDSTEKVNVRIPNLDADLIKAIANKLNLTFTPEKENTKNTFAPIDIVDYIYAVLHSPNYREKYQAFLKIDFPRVPYPNNKTFWQLVQLGGELRQLHLLESEQLNENILSVTYPIIGLDCITRKITKNDFELINVTNKTGRVWINTNQYFDNVPLIAWEFYIGGYQPAQKWLKDRYNRVLTSEDILHYKKMIQALNKTHQIMQKIDEVRYNKCN